MIQWQESRTINKKDKIKLKENIISYYKMKIITFDKIINDKTITKSELLIILYILSLYKITYQRIWTLNLNNMLNQIFKSNNIRQYKITFINTLEKLKDWKYDDGSLFICSYDISGKNIILNLDKTKKNY
jgi:hypothetical protein